MIRSQIELLKGLAGVVTLPCDTSSIPSMTTFEGLYRHEGIHAHAVAEINTHFDNILRDLLVLEHDMKEAARVLQTIHVYQKRLELQGRLKDQAKEAGREERKFRKQKKNIQLQMVQDSLEDEEDANLDLSES